METHMEGKMYGVLYRGYNVWSLILGVQIMGTHIEGTIFGGSYRE